MDSTLVKWVAGIEGRGRGFEYGWWNNIVTAAEAEEEIDTLAPFECHKCLQLACSTSIQRPYDLVQLVPGARLPTASKNQVGDD